MRWRARTLLRQGGGTWQSLRESGPRAVLVTAAVLRTSIQPRPWDSGPCSGCRKGGNRRETLT